MDQPSKFPSLKSSMIENWADAALPALRAAAHTHPAASFMAFLRSPTPRSWSRGTYPRNRGRAMRGRFFPAVGALAIIAAPVGIEAPGSTDISEVDILS